MNLVDSSAWLEYFAKGPNAEAFAEPIEDVARLVVPSIVVYEVFRRVLQQKGEDDAFRAVTFLEHGRVVDLDAELAVAAAKVGQELGLPLADSVIYATARAASATVWTQDEDFEGLEGVRFVPKG